MMLRVSSICFMHILDASFLPEQNTLFYLKRLSYWLFFTLKLRWNKNKKRRHIFPNARQTHEVLKGISGYVYVSVIFADPDDWFCLVWFTSSVETWWWYGTVQHVSKGSKIALKNNHIDRGRLMAFEEWKMFIIRSLKLLSISEFF